MTDPADDLWGRGDYPAMARRLEPAAALVAGGAGPGRGRFALDVAAGTGSVALRLADAGWRVTATDGSAHLVALGEQATDHEIQEVEWLRADLAAQPCPDASQDLVTSSFGLIFAADPVAAMAEVARVLTPAGRLALTSWTDDGHMAGMTEAMAAYLPAPGGAHRPRRWGSPSFLEELLAPRFLDVRIDTHTLPWTFPSAAAGRRWLERTSPAHLGAMALAGEHAEEMMDAVEEHLAGYADRFGRVEVAAEFRLVRAQRVP
ncbi:class I SAM-dependent methyltransferase [Nocardioides humi]|uniref:Class I SAM-dependent methyltransferase n=1 Tax=Nocardioides humi TaxID=449461 RepID=A0ABN2A555_9ACTN|nr:class I SAM-dependent methyltransferase [Nocardioides humi]